MSTRTARPSRWSAPPWTAPRLLSLPSRLPRFDRFAAARSPTPGNWRLAEAPSERTPPQFLAVRSAPAACAEEGDVFRRVGTLPRICETDPCMVLVVPNPKKIRAFRSEAAFEAWLRANHARETEIWLRTYKKGAGKPTVTSAQALDVALCWGWIDGLRKG